MNNDEKYTEIDGIVFMTAKQSIDWINANGIKEDKDLQAIMQDSMEAELELIKAQEKDNPTFIPALNPPNTDKINQSLKVKRVK